MAEDVDADLISLAAGSRGLTRTICWAAPPPGRRPRRHARCWSVARHRRVSAPPPAERSAGWHRVLAVCEKTQGVPRSAAAARLASMDSVIDVAACGCGTARTTCCTASTSRRPGRGARPCSGRTAPARPPRSRSSRASGCGRPARSTVLGEDPAHARRAVAGADRCRAAVLARPRQVAGAGAARRTSAATTRRTPRRERRGRWDTDELIATVGLTEHGGPEDRHAVRRSAAPARRGDRHRRPARAAVPGRADRRLRPAGAARVPRPGASAWPIWRTPRSCSPPTTSTRPRSSPTGS